MLSCVPRAGWFLLVLVCSLLAVGSVPPRAHAASPANPDYAISPSWPSNIQSFLQIETSEQIFDVLYRYGQNRPAADGAYGANIGAPRSAWLIEEQRAGGVDVIAGVLRQDTTLIGLGLKMFHYGFARQASDGSFPGTAWPFHSTAMFLAEAAPSLLILRHSSYGQQFKQEAGWEIPRMERAALHMVRAVGGPGHIDDRTKNHRYYEAALALDATGILSHNRTLQRWSHVYARLGIRMERPDGVMPEDGGHDTGYQALGMIDVARYLELQGRSRLATSLYHALQLGEAWEISRVRANGSVNQAGDTRTVGCKEHNPLGKCKTVFYAPIFNALARWGMISGDVRFEGAAHQVWLRQQQ